MAKELIITLPANAVDIFTDGEEFNKLYGKIEKIAKAHKPDLTTKTGRSETVYDIEQVLINANEGDPAFNIAVDVHGAIEDGTIRYVALI